MSTNRTSKAIDTILYAGLTPNKDFFRAIAEKYKRMEEALRYIHDREHLTFAECTDAEDIILAAREALALDPLP
jgi:hypothetical protein